VGRLFIAEIDLGCALSVPPKIYFFIFGGTMASLALLAIRNFTTFLCGNFDRFAGGRVPPNSGFAINFDKPSNSR
jgi:hypothetical protein